MFVVCRVDESIPLVSECSFVIYNGIVCIYTYTGSYFPQSSYVTKKLHPWVLANIFQSHNPREYIHNGYKEYLSPINFVVVVVISLFFCLFDCLIDGVPVQFFMEVDFSISPAELTYFSVSRVFTSRMILEVPR